MGINKVSPLIFLAMMLLVENTAYAVSYTYYTIDTPGFLSTNVWGLNDSSQMVGNYSYDTTVYHGFYPTGVGGSFTTFDSSDSSATNALTRGFSIKNSDAIAGQYYDSTTPSSYYLTSIGGTEAYTNPLDPLCATYNRGFGFNNSEQLTGAYVNGSGEHGYFLPSYTSSNYTTIDYPPGTLDIRINNLGQIVGSYTANGTTFHSYYLSGLGGPFTTIDPSILDAVFSEALGLNDHGAIVGCFYDAVGNYHGWLVIWGGRYLYRD
jgi:hypothetical protein